MTDLRDITPKGLGIGRIVHYVLPSGPSKGQHRPAIVVRVWNPEGLVQLQVFTDGLNDGLLNTEWQTSVTYSSQPTEGTWHYLEYVN